MALNANHFFIAIFLVLLSIFVFFKPMPIAPSLADNAEIAALELQNFTLYTLGVAGLKEITIGRYGFRYDDRIEVEEIDYTNSSNEHRNNLQADFGVYNNQELITLEGNVRYYREDGMKFKTEQALINKKDETITTTGPFTLDRGSDHADGIDLFYDSKNDITDAKGVTAFYTLTNKE